ncbi:hypothetical protein NPIL_112571 [Nephila pilipes]|uniref:Uncharacterized protein n=1 Tax=Nephila pilipes TaxID=299642 RepID=A0A8X6MX97_NEPPI|nr:hypothetical protein NPIL_112571 [Nephila pilipes]
MANCVSFLFTINRNNPCQSDKLKKRYRFQIHWKKSCYQINCTAPALRSKSLFNPCGSLFPLPKALNCFPFYTNSFSFQTEFLSEVYVLSKVETTWHQTKNSEKNGSEKCSNESTSVMTVENEAVSVGLGKRRIAYDLLFDITYMNCLGEYFTLNGFCRRLPGDSFRT